MLFLPNRETLQLIIFNLCFFLLPLQLYYNESIGYGYYKKTDGMAYKLGI